MTNTFAIGNAPASLTMAHTFLRAALATPAEHPVQGQEPGTTAWRFAVIRRQELDALLAYLPPAADGGTVYIRMPRTDDGWGVYRATMWRPTLGGVPEYAAFLHGVVVRFTDLQPIPEDTHDDGERIR